MHPITLAAVFESLILGVAMAVDAMTVTISNTLCEPDMPRSKRYAMPLMFALFQAGMPVLGFAGGTMVASLVEAYAGIISLAILAVVGGRMIVEAIRELHEPEACRSSRLSWGDILLESVATSIDALVVGVSIATAGGNIALNATMIGLTTLACCLIVLRIGSRLGEHFGSHAKVAGGVVLIIIGLRAFLS